MALYPGQKAIKDPMQADWGRQTQSQGYPGGMTGMYDAAAETQAQDYDNIMKGYNNLLSSGGVNPSTMTNIQGETYQRGGDVNKLIQNLQGYANTGGYSEQDQAALRSRGISPIRAAYANAERNMARQKSLSGGYSPNAGALAAKMAREQGSLSSQASSDVNAKIAEMVATGKLAGMQTLSPLLQHEAGLQAGVNQRNTQLQKDIGMYNANEISRVNALNAQGKQNALQGMTNLYGTTPGLTNMFGNQVLQNNAQQLGAVQTANQIKNQRAGLGINVLGQANQNPKFG